MRATGCEPFAGERYSLAMSSIAQDLPPPGQRRHPYRDQPPSAFWRTGVAADPAALQALYRPTWTLSATDRIATAGSCFAQHIGRALRGAGVALLDLEPPPDALPVELHARFGFGVYSARYGNLYTARQLRQLAEQAFGERDPEPVVWTRDGRFFDALRPSVEPEGLDSVDEVRRHRAWHLERVRALLLEMDVFIFTLGLTESWIDRATGLALPSAPGVIAGRYTPGEVELVRFDVGQVCEDLEAFRALLARHRADTCRLVLTVSPVPLTATATTDHVLLATTASKAILRAAAEALRLTHPDVDYVPSFELIANPYNGGVYFGPNRRTVTAEGVARATGMFLEAHGLRRPADASAPSPTAAPPEAIEDDPTVCEDALLDAFAR